MNRLAKNSIAAGLTTLLVTTGLSFSAFGADSSTGQSDASALTATGFADLIDTGICEAMSTNGASTGTGTCGTGLATQGTGTFNQNASTGDGGTSAAAAEVESVDIDGLTTIDLGTIPTDLQNIDTSTALDDIVRALFGGGDDGGGGGGLPDLGDLFPGGLDGLGLGDLSPEQLDFLNDLGLGDLSESDVQNLSDILQPILDPLQDNAVDPIAEAFDDALPVSIEIGAVTSQCTAQAGQNATGTSSIAGIDIVIELGDSGDTDIRIPVTIQTDPNSDLIGSIALTQISDGITQGLEDSLNTSFDGEAGPLADLVGQVQDQVIAEILDQADVILEPLSDAVAPLFEGTVNKQVVGDDGESIEVTALDLTILGLEGAGDFFGDNSEAAPAGANLQIARVSCGPNGAAQVDNDDDGNADVDGPVADGTNADADAVADADANDDGTPVASIADADSAADADVQASLPNAGAPNLLPFFLLGIALLAFGLAVLLNERRRLGLPSSDNLA
ncbi:hypothetical protein [Aeromicrobium sp. CF3.5]|uniref:hypothetical protein n=1 Tax=Aeromicrobium sp. CF3.5 TaxID=3373078 RepID=UPI003EE6D353